MKLPKYVLKSGAQTEYRLQVQIAGLLRVAGKPGLVWWHTPNTPRNARQGSSLKLMGMRAGVSDLCFLYHGNFYALELKSEGGTLSLEQSDFLSDVKFAGGRAATAYGYEDALHWLRKWGLLR